MGPRPQLVLRWALVLLLLPSWAAAAGVKMTVADVETPPGTAVDVPVTLNRVGTDDEPVVAGIEIELLWNPGVVYLDEVIPLEPVDDWPIAVNYERDGAHLALASPTGLVVTDTPETILLLRFRTSPLRGYSLLFLAAQPIFGPDAERLTLYFSHGSVDTRTATPVEPTSVGVLKHAYRE